jgi:general secretion pathway protein J
VNGSARRARGFTLIELVLAMLLLSLGLALGLAVLRSAQAVATRGEAIAARTERMRATGEFLRRRLSAVLPIAHRSARAGAERVLFVGEPERMAFVADLPAYLGRGGPYLHELQAGTDAHGRSLQLRLSLPPDGGAAADAPARAPEHLAGGLRSVRFRYRGLDPSGRLLDWQPRWPWPERLPLLVEVAVEPVDDIAWPVLVVALPQDPGVAR